MHRTHSKRLLLIVGLLAVFLVSTSNSLSNSIIDSGYPFVLVGNGETKQEGEDHRIESAKQKAIHRFGATSQQKSSVAASRRSELKILLLSRLLSTITIYVNIATFRDVLCAETVRDLFAMANHPERIAAGIVDQRHVGDRLCLPLEYLRYIPAPKGPTTQAPNRDPEFPSFPKRFVSCYKKNFCPSDNIRIRYIEWVEARGPTYGRYVAGLMYQGESFYMMMDSHSRFEARFDDILLYDVLRARPTIEGKTAGGRGAVLSHYPSPFVRYDSSAPLGDQIMAMCKTQFTVPHGIIKNGARWVKQPKRPLLQPYTAAGFVFSDATAQLDVPFDPYLDFVFDGEEILYTVRLYTAGYDAYMPGRTSIFHHYERRFAPRFSSVPKAWYRVQRITLKRVHYFLETYMNRSSSLMVDEEEARRFHVDVRKDLYGLRDVRTIAQFYAFAAVNRSLWISDEKEKICDRMIAEGQQLKSKYPNVN